MPTTDSSISARSKGSTVARIEAWSLATAIVIMSIVHHAVTIENKETHNLAKFLIYGDRVRIAWVLAKA
jgi:hypothetical protein